MAYPTGIEFKPTSPVMGLQPIQETSTTKQHELGTIVRATDVNYGEGEFIYLSGAASTAAGDLVCYNSKTGATVRTEHAVTGSNGPCGVAMSANLASQYGWYQIHGSGPVKSGTVAADAALYITATAGSVDDAVVAGDLIDGLVSKAATSSGYTTCQVDRPNIGASSVAGSQAFTDPITYSAATTITAFATGGQASATALTEEVNFVTVCATAGDSVKLPTAALGLHVVVFNEGATACDVFPTTGGAIDAGAANAAVSVAAASSREFFGQSATQWRSYSGEEPATASVPGVVSTGVQSIAGAKTLTGLLTVKGATAITAFATGGQASATALTSNLNFVTVCATNADSVKLPTGALGMIVTVFNLGAANCEVFPVSGGQIDALGANAAYTINAGASRVFHGLSATQWHSKA